MACNATLPFSPHCAACILMNNYRCRPGRTLGLPAARGVCIFLNINSEACLLYSQAAKFSTFLIFLFFAPSGPYICAQSGRYTIDGFPFWRRYFCAAEKNERPTQEPLKFRSLYSPKAERRNDQRKEIGMPVYRTTG